MFARKISNNLRLHFYVGDLMGILVHYSAAWGWRQAGEIVQSAEYTRDGPYDLPESMLSRDYNILSLVKASKQRSSRSRAAQASAAPGPPTTVSPISRAIHGPANVVRPA